jgi:hypothetical protein
LPYILHLNHHSKVNISFLSDVRKEKRKKMSSNIINEEHDPVANLIMHPVRGILKSSKSIDDSRLDTDQKKMSSINNYPITGMTRSESKR